MFLSMLHCIIPALALPHQGCVPIAGRLLCDTYLSARELVKEVDYTLATLSRNLLSQERQELAAADVPGMGLYQNTLSHILHLNHTSK